MLSVPFSRGISLSPKLGLQHGSMPKENCQLLYNFSIIISWVTWIGRTVRVGSGVTVSDTMHKRAFPFCDI